MMKSFIKRIVVRIFLRKIDGVSINTRRLTVKNWGKIYSMGFARLGSGGLETSSFFATKSSSVLDNTGTIELGDQSFITENYRIMNRGTITVGHSSYINPNAVIRIQKSLRIGNDCAISWNCTFLDTHHHKLNGKDEAEEIVIGDKVWIGAHVMMLKGSGLGNNCIVAAGSVVTKKFGDNLLIGGVPAKVIKENQEWDK